MGIAEMLDELKQKALHDPKLRAELLATKKASQPFAAFCSKCRELGYEIYDMDLIRQGKRLMQPCGEAQTGAARILRCWKGKMTFTSCFLQDCRRL